MAREKFLQTIEQCYLNIQDSCFMGTIWGNTSSKYETFWDWYPFYQEQGTGTANSGWLIDGQRVNTASLPGIVNSTMTWETVETWDIGFDLAAFTTD